jgi:transposase
MFKLEGYVLDKVEHHLEYTFLFCHTQKWTMKHCGETSRNVCETRERKLFHMMIEDKMIILVVKQKRFYFSKYKKRFWESLPGVGKRKQCTEHFELNTLRELQRDNYSGTGKKRNKSGMFTMRLLDKLDLIGKWLKKVEKVGIDGKYVRGTKQVHHFVDLDERKTIFTLPDQSQKSLKEEILKIPAARRMLIKEACTDMDPFYINLAKECFPLAKVVIDHYHLIQWGIKKMDELRLILQTVRKQKFPVKHILAKPSHKLTKAEFAKLQPCFKTFPEVKVAWKIVHQLRKIYYQKNWKQGYSQLRKVIWLCEQSQIDQMKDLAKTLKRWKYEILNYYISKTTNALTEALHNRFETIKRNHCGIRNVERFAKRLMFCVLPFITIAEIFAHRC